MSSGARLSAFAKRRKLDNGFIKSDTSSPEPVSSKANNGITKPPKANTRKVEEASRKIAINSDCQSSTITIHDHNSFDPLIAANVVSFSGSREVEKVNNTTLKIRLSKGQKCFLQGVAQLWIREGSILLQGAILSESTNVYTVFGSPTDELLEVIAHSKVAEFQLESIPDHDLDLPSVRNVPGRLGRISQRLPASFELLEIDQTYKKILADESTSKLYKQIQGLLLEPPKLIQVTESPRLENAQERRNTHPRILIAGKRSTATSKISMVTINSLLTGKFSQYSIRCVAFLDLDHISPTFACPGTVSLSMHELPTLGPSFTSPLQPQINAPNRLICSWFIGFSEQSTSGAYNTCLLEQLLLKIPENTPLIIRVGTNFGDLQHKKLFEFASLAAVSTCICAALSKSSALYEAIQTLTDRLHGTLKQLKLSTTISGSSSLEAHKLAIRSHFCLQTFTNCLPRWSLLSMLKNSANKLHLSIDNNSTRLAFVVIRGGILRHEDVPEALKGSLVALVMREVDNNHNTMSSKFEIQMQGFENVWNPLEYIGIALVESVTDTMDSFTLIANIDEEQLRGRSETGQRLGIILEKPGIDDKFTSQVLQD